MLPICIAIIILAISVIVLSLNCLRLDKRIHNSVKYMDEKGFEIRIPYLAKSVSSLQDSSRELHRRTKNLEDNHFEDDISGLKADYTKLINYLTAKQGVSCVDCIHASVCDSSKTMCKSDEFGVNFVNGKGLTFKTVGLCSKFVAKKDDTIYGTTGPIE